MKVLFCNYPSDTCISLHDLGILTTFSNADSGSIYHNLFTTYKKLYNSIYDLPLKVNTQSNNSKSNTVAILKLRQYFLDAKYDVMFLPFNSSISEQFLILIQTILPSISCLTQITPS